MTIYYKSKFLFISNIILYCEIYVRVWCIKNTLTYRWHLFDITIDFQIIPHIHRTNLNTWNAKWTSHTSFAKWYKSIVSEIPGIPWFLNFQSFWILCYFLRKTKIRTLSITRLGFLLRSRYIPYCFRPSCNT